MSDEGGAPSRDTRRRDPEARMSFMEHLLELRSRLIVASAALVVAIVLTFIFYQPVFDFLRAPLGDISEKFRTDEGYQQLMAERGLDPTQAVVRPITVNPLGLLLILMKVALWGGIVLASPVILHQVWVFVAPGLKPHEARAVRPVLIGGIFCFLAGAAFCYYLVFPLTLEFLVWLDVKLGYQPSYTPDQYIGMLLTFMLIFGAVFEMPLVAAVLARLRLLKPVWLTRHWRYVILVCFGLGSVLSPGSEVFSMLLLSGALVVLYVASVALAWLCYPKEQAGERAG
jgi:sec-independent protein translocase protein TatC